VRISIDRDRCMGSGSCGFYAPATFDIDDEMKAFVIDPGGDPDERIQLAAASCPTNAITLTEGEG
jgi:ferredoxin